MDEAMIRVPVPREFLLQVGWADGDDKPMTLLPRMMQKFPLTLGDFAVGDWYVVGIEITMERSQLNVGEQHRQPLSAPLALIPRYWVMLSRVLP